MKILITENQLRKVQFKYLDYLFDGISEIKSEDYPDSRFWEKDGEKIMRLDDGDLYVRQDIWKNISNMFSLNYDETQRVIKEWVEFNFNLDSVTPYNPKEKRKLYNG